LHLVMPQVVWTSPRVSSLSTITLAI
jgi:hypothetical protein